MQGTMMWCSVLACEWISWAVVGDGILRLDMPEYQCCDMRGAIKIAQVLCPLVRRIDTYAGGALDITYSRRGGEWVALDQRRHAIPG